MPVHPHLISSTAMPIHYPIQRHSSHPIWMSACLWTRLIHLPAQRDYRRVTMVMARREPRLAGSCLGVAGLKGARTRIHPMGQIQSIRGWFGATFLSTYLSGTGVSRLVRLLGDS